MEQKLTQLGHHSMSHNVPLDMASFHIYHEKDVRPNTSPLEQLFPDVVCELPGEGGSQELSMARSEPQIFLALSTLMISLSSGAKQLVLSPIPSPPPGPEQPHPYGIGPA
ncbi:hypothetical protein H920_11787 [Fukomys damarensis]|uniref:Uncharacterized protein n=1 Tax=Fukomys damarensis TaxID=885580 RepID=A0A091D6W2_FUKDA|nr:hypothetical protein H920_11787 [Fukomys damarensis]